MMEPYEYLAGKYRPFPEREVEAVQREFSPLVASAARSALAEWADSVSASVIQGWGSAGLSIEIAPDSPLGGLTKRLDIWDFAAFREEPLLSRRSGALVSLYISWEDPKEGHPHERRLQAVQEKEDYFASRWQSEPGTCVYRLPPHAVYEVPPTGARRDLAQRVAQAIAGAIARWNQEVRERLLTPGRGATWSGRRRSLPLPREDGERLYLSHAAEMPDPEYFPVPVDRAKNPLSPAKAPASIVPAATGACPQCGGSVKLAKGRRATPGGAELLGYCRDCLTRLERRDGAWQATGS